MAKANNSIFVRGLNGSLGGQFVIRKGRGGETIVSNTLPFREDRQFNQNQLDHQDLFRRAILYAKTVKNDELYIKKAAGTNKTPFKAAVADYFKKPAILEIDASEWQGTVGNEIYVQAVDDTPATKVHVTISDQNGTVLEEGNTQRTACLWWTYTAHTQVTPVPMEPKPHLVVIAYDQPGHSAEMVWEN